ncbi:MAG: hypothetical protein HND55_04145 [Pseudomonadota bacterium]|nr:MAG: hypothetical protein HND55_04145 [Pseudomonadota bacterium]
MEIGSVGYQRHYPEQTLLYQIVERHYPAFVEHLADAGKQLPGHVRQAFDAYLQCGRLEHGFLRLRCDTCHAEHLLAFSCKVSAYKSPPLTLPGSNASISSMVSASGSS